MNTESVQNSLSRLLKAVDLGVADPNPTLKRRYFKACQALDAARHEFDLLNDLKLISGK